MGVQYDFSIKDTEDALPVDAGIDGWDAIIQINSVTSRRLAAQTPTSLISRLVDFRGGTENGTGVGTEGYALASAGTISLLTADASSLTKDLMFVPTMVGLMIHPSSSGAMSSDFTGCIVVRNTGTVPQTSRALTPAFSLVPSVVALNAANVGTYTALEDAVPVANTPTMSAVATASPAVTSVYQSLNITVNATTNVFTASATHNLSSGHVVQFKSTANLPSPLQANTNYFVIATNLTTTAFSVSTTLNGTAVDVTTAGTGTVSFVNMTNNYAGYYYLCPVNKGWWQYSAGNNCGGTPLRGINLRSFSTSPFIPDAATTTANPTYRYTTPNSITNPLVEIVLAHAAGTNTCRFAVVDLYGMMIPGTP
jgi:hypothetical protein